MARRYKILAVLNQDAMFRLTPQTAKGNQLPSRLSKPPAEAQNGYLSTIANDFPALDSGARTGTRTGVGGLGEKRKKKKKYNWGDHDVKPLSFVWTKIGDGKSFSAKNTGN